MNLIGMIHLWPEMRSREGRTKHKSVGGDGERASEIYPKAGGG